MVLDIKRHSKLVLESKALLNQKTNFKCTNLELSLGRITRNKKHRKKIKLNAKEYQWVCVKYTGKVLSPANKCFVKLTPINITSTASTFSRVQIDKMASRFSMTYNLKPCSVIIEPLNLNMCQNTSVTSISKRIKTIKKCSVNAKRPLRPLRNCSITLRGVSNVKNKLEESQFKTRLKKQGNVMCDTSLKPTTNVCSVILKPLSLKVAKVMSPVKVNLPKLSDKLEYVTKDIEQPSSSNGSKLKAPLPKVNRKIPRVGQSNGSSNSKEDYKKKLTNKPRKTQNSLNNITPTSTVNSISTGNSQKYPIRSLHPSILHTCKINGNVDLPSTKVTLSRIPETTVRPVSISIKKLSEPSSNVTVLNKPLKQNSGLQNEILTNCLPITKFNRYLTKSRAQERQYKEATLRSNVDSTQLGALISSPILSTIAISLKNPSTSRQLITPSQATQTLTPRTILHKISEINQAQRGKSTLLSSFFVPRLDNEPIAQTTSDYDTEVDLFPNIPSMSKFPSLNTEPQLETHCKIKDSDSNAGFNNFNENQSVDQNVVTDSDSNAGFNNFNENHNENQSVDENVTMESNSNFSLGETSGKEVTLFRSCLTLGESETNGSARNIQTKPQQTEVPSGGSNSMKLGKPIADPKVLLEAWLQWTDLHKNDLLYQSF